MDLTRVTQVTTCAGGIYNCGPSYYQVDDITDPLLGQCIRLTLAGSVVVIPVRAVAAVTYGASGVR